MKKPAIEAIAIDLDGTLLTSKKTITPYTLSVLQRAMEQGIKIIIATGRSLATCERYVKQVGSTSPLICYNGSCIYDVVTGKDIFHQTMDEETSSHIISLIDSTPAAFHAFRNHIVHYKEHGRHADFLEPLSSKIGVITEDFAALSPLSFTKAMFIGEYEDTEKIRLELLKKCQNKIHLVYSHPTYFEMMSEGATKGFALEKLLAEYGIDKENTMAIGDESNDIEMLKLVTHSVAMGNCGKGVADVALYQTTSSDEDGVAKAIEKWALN
ncbi:MAG: HAD family phosphatase [Spirochaetia bacterium]|nr:HAD family phosphatase [Spirochaetia bacterium]